MPPSNPVYGYHFFHGGLVAGGWHTWNEDEIDIHSTNHAAARRSKIGKFRKIQILVIVLAYLIFLSQDTESPLFTVGVAVRSTTASVTLTRRGSQTTSSGFYFRRENWRKTRGARKEHPRVFLEKKPEELKNIILRFFFTEELKERLYSILEL